MMLATDRLPGTDVRLGNLLDVGGNAGGKEMVSLLAEHLLGEQASPETVEAILNKGGLGTNFQQAAYRPGRRRPEVATVAGLLLASPEFQRR